MKPFNLQEALTGKPVINRDGRKILQLHYFDKAIKETYKIAALSEDGTITSHKDDGKWSDQISANDLFMASEKKKLYIL